MRLLCLGVLVTLATVSAASARTWTSRTGETHVSGTLLGVKDGAVYVGLEDGTQKQASWEQLSQSDQRYVLKMLADQDNRISDQVSLPSSEATAAADTNRAAKLVDDKRGVGLPVSPASARQNAAVETDSARQASTSEVKTAQASGGPRLVYFGHHGTYHLTPTNGTAHSMYCDGSTLVALHYSRASQLYFHYRVTEPGLQNEEWAFSRHPYWCHYAIWRYADFNGDGRLEWRWVDSGHRVRPTSPGP